MTRSRTGSGGAGGERLKGGIQRGGPLGGADPDPAPSIHEGGAEIAILAGKTIPQRKRVHPTGTRHTTLPGQMQAHHPGRSGEVEATLGILLDPLNIVAGQVQERVPGEDLPSPRRLQIQAGQPAPQRAGPQPAAAIGAGAGVKGVDVAVGDAGCGPEGGPTFPLQAADATPPSADP